MTQQLILHLKNDGEPHGLYRYDVQSKKCESIAIEDWSDSRIQKQPLIILLPANWVYHTSTQISSKNIELLSKSVPFAVEEELSNDVEDNYFAFSVAGDSSQSVAVIEKNHLDQLHQRSKQAGINIQAIYSEADWLPGAAHAIHLWQDEGSSLIRFGLDTAMRVANSEVSKLVPVFGADAQSICSNVLLNLEHDDIQIRTDLTTGLCCEALMNSQAINLYVDEIKDEQQNKNNSGWRTVAVLMLALVLSWLTIQGIQWQGLNSAIDDLKQQQQNLLVQSFPDAASSELVDPFAALQSRLKLQNNTSGKQTGVLIDALHGVGQTLRQESTVQVRGLRLVDDKIELQISAPAMSQINAFHQALQLHANQFNVQIGVNELTDDNSFRSILTLVAQ